jgi:predicted nuclease of predicted toxin-antitoxin system
MKFIVDQPVSPILADWLRSSGHDAFHVRERGLSAASDSVIFDLAVEESRIIVTTDLDFARILALSGRVGPALILFRAGNLSDSEMLGLLQAALAKVDAEQLARSVVVVDGTRMRIAPLPLRPDLA